MYEFKNCNNKTRTAISIGSAPRYIIEQHYRKQNTISWDIRSIKDKHVDRIEVREEESNNGARMDIHNISKIQCLEKLSQTVGLQMTFFLRAEYI